MTERKNSPAARLLGCGLAVAALVWCFGRIAGPQGLGRLLAAPPAQIGNGPAANPRGGGFVQFGRRIVANPDPADDQDPESAFIRPEHDTQRHFDKAQELLEKGHYGDAILYLQEILDGPQDSRVMPEPSDQAPAGSDDAPADGSQNAAVPSGQFFQGLKFRAQQIISNLPPEGLKTYELLYGAKAEHKLNDALAAGNMSDVAAVSRQYFNTAAGYQATLLLGHHELDHNRPLAAALCFQRLRDAPAAAKWEPSLSVLLASCWARGGEESRAVEALAQLRREFPGATVRIAGKGVNLPGNDAQALAWLQSKIGQDHPAADVESDEWTMPRGNPARNAVSAGGMPLLIPRWRSTIEGSPAAEKAVSEARQDNIDRSIPVLPVAQPLAVGDTIFRRGTSGLWGIDFATGNRISHVAVPPQGDTAADRGQQPNAIVGPMMIRGPGFFGGDPNFSERPSENATLGTMTSDGQRVFIVEDLPGPAPAARVQMTMRGPQQIVDESTTNILSAWEVRSQAKRAWLVGGRKGQKLSAEPKLDGAYFLGPPLPLMGQLYVLAEIKQEICLEVLDGATGKLQWDQGLIAVDSDSIEDMSPRLTGVSPSYADGVLVCPTSAGAVVAIDLATRTLLWGFQYKAANSPQQMQQIQIRRWQIRNGNIGSNFSVQNSLGDHWLDSTATIADGCVLLTPVDSEQLYCLSLVGGKVADGKRDVIVWAHDRGDNIYIGGVQDGRVLLVGRRQVQCWHLAGDPSGKWKARDSAWPTALELPDGAMPSGRGFMAKGSYFLPLSTAEVIQIDLATGRIIGRAKSRYGAVPGNLICYRDQIISLGVDSLDAFFQLDPLRQQVAKTLAKNSDDPVALAGRGEIELDQGKPDAAIADLRRSFELASASSDTHVRDFSQLPRKLLVEGLVSALQTDFAGWRGHIDEVQRLINSDSQQIDLLRTLGDGLAKSGDRQGALDTYLRLVDLPWGTGEPEQIAPNLSVRPDAWVQARLQSLYAAASATERPKMDATFAARVEAAVAETGPIELRLKKLRQAVNFFGFHVAADEARVQLVKLLGATSAKQGEVEDSLVERESLLRQLERSADPAHRRAAVARLAGFYYSIPRFPEAASYYRRLKGELADQVCLDGKTGRQLADELRSTAMPSSLTAELTTWPSGHVTKDILGPRGQRQGNMMQRSLNIPWRGAREPIFETSTVTFELQQQPPLLIGRDGSGHEQFRIQVGEQGVYRQWQPTPSLSYVVAQGHLLLVNLGNQTLVAIDALSRPGATGHVLWERELVDLPAGMYNGAVPAREIKSPWGPSRWVPAANQNGAAISVVGPVTERCICILRSRDLLALDPRTGAVLWTRHGMPPDSEVFGDDEVLVVAPPKGGDAILLRTIDGELLGTRAVPANEPSPTGHAPLLAACHGREMLVSRLEDGGKLLFTLVDPWRDKQRVLGEFSPGAKATLVADDALAVFEGKTGHFLLISLDDGRKLIDETLESEPLLDAIYVQKSPGQYLLVVNRGAPQNGGMQAFNPMLNDANSPLINVGHVYAFDSATGKKLWPSPAVVNRWHILLGQGQDLPVVVFVRLSSVGGQGMGGTVNPGNPFKCSVLCLDRRDGRALFDEELSNPLNMNNAGIEVTGDRQSKTVSILLPTQTVSLTFSDAPTPPEPPYQASLAARQSQFAGTSARDVLRALRNSSVGSDDGDPSVWNGVIDASKY